MRSSVASILAVSGLLWAGAVTAATTVNVHPTCVGIPAPCFTTIQAGVNNAGGGASTVNIYPGTYNESVDISLMGSSDGAQGNLTLQGVASGGAPAVGMATVNGTGGTLGEAFWNSVDPFPFSVTINGLNVTSGTTDAIDFEGVNGATLNDVVATNATFDGVDIRSSDTVTINRSTSSNNGNDGFQIVLEDDGDVLITDSVATNNLSGTGEGDGSEDDGFMIRVFNGLVNISGTAANDNGDDGFNIQPLFGAGTITSITITGSEARRNGAQVAAAKGTSGTVCASTSSCDGFDIIGENDGGEFLGDVTIIDTTAADNFGDGFQIEEISFGAVTITNSHALRNSTEGFEIEPEEGTDDDGLITMVTVTDSTAFENGLVSESSGDGFQIQPGCSEDVEIANITITNSTSSRNSGDGFDLTADVLVLTGVTANENGFLEESGDGIQSNTRNAPCVASSVQMTNITANGNASDGVETGATGMATLTNITASGNGFRNEPLKGENNFEDGIEIHGGDPIALNGCVADSNGDDGVDIQGDGSVTVDGCSANNNGEDGIDVTDDSSDPGTPAPVNTSATVINSDAAGNGDDGIDAAAAGFVRIQNVCTESHLDDGMVIKVTDGNLDILDSTTLANIDAGINLEDIGSGVFTIDNTNIEDNSDGVTNVGNSVTVAAGGNWWSNGSGPLHPNNPGGSGDSVIDGANGGVGTVQFAGFLGAPAGGARLCPSQTAIPALSPWGAGIVLLLVGLVGLLVLGRRMILN